MNKNILVVDDEERILSAISIYLQAEGFKVLTADTGKKALEVFFSNSIDLIILDIMLPDIKGYEVCKAIREHSDVPILFLTALGDDDSHTLGYRVGADDYIIKPFKISILALKAKRILEKHSKSDPSILDFRSIKLNLLARTSFINEKPLLLTPREFDLLKEFVLNPGRVLTREYLLRNVWKSDYYEDIRLVDAMVKKLRKKMGKEAELIHTVISVGYKLEDHS